MAPCRIAADDGIGVVLTHGRPARYTVDKLHSTLRLFPKPNFMQAAVHSDSLAQTWNDFGRKNCPSFLCPFLLNTNFRPEDTADSKGRQRQK